MRCHLVGSIGRRGSLSQTDWRSKAYSQIQIGFDPQNRDQLLGQKMENKSSLFGFILVET